MLAIERKQAILSHLARNGTVSVADLCLLYSVSEMTIRRDLVDLEKQGMLQRTYGGAVPTEPAFFEMSSRAKLSLFTEEKERIGKLCAELVKDGDVVFIDSGTTTLQVARFLVNRSFTLITNDLNIASEMLNYRNIEIYVVGGTLRRGANSLIGPKAISFFDDIRGDKLFLAVEGVDVTGGFTVPDMNEVQLKRKMVYSARETIVVADHSKLGRNTMGIIVPLSEAKCLVTDHNAPEPLLTEIRKHINVTLA